MQVSTTPLLHPFSTSSINTSMNTVRVKKANIIQVVEIQITLQDGHHLVNYNEIHEKLQAFVSLDKQGFGQSRFGWMHCKLYRLLVACHGQKNLSLYKF